MSAEAQTESRRVLPGNGDISPTGEGQPGAGRKTLQGDPQVYMAGLGPRRRVPRVGQGYFMGHLRISIGNIFSSIHQPCGPPGPQRTP